MATVFLWLDGRVLFSHLNRDVVLLEQLYPTLETSFFILSLGMELKFLALPQFICWHTVFAASFFHVLREPESQYVLVPCSIPTIPVHESFPLRKTSLCSKRNSNRDVINIRINDIMKDRQYRKKITSMTASTLPWHNSRRLLKGETIFSRRRPGCQPATLNNNQSISELQHKQSFKIRAR